MLYEIAVLCDKYDIVGAIRKLVEPWFRKWKDDEERDTTRDDKELYITWVFGHEQMFKILLASIVNYMAVRPSDKVVGDAYCYMARLQKPLPLPVVEYIFGARRELLSQKLNTLNGLYKPLVVSNAPEAFTVLGALVQTMHAVGITPSMTTAEDITGTYGDLKWKLNKCNKFALFNKSDERFFTDKGDAKGCLAAPLKVFKDWDKSLYNAPYTPDIPEKFCLHLKNQAAK